MPVLRLYLGDRFQEVDRFKNDVQLDRVFDFLHNCVRTVLVGMPRAEHFAESAFGRCELCVLRMGRLAALRIVAVVNGVRVWYRALDGKCAKTKAGCGHCFADFESRHSVLLQIL